MSEPKSAPSRHARNLTDVGNAERLVDRHGNDVRYCPKLEQWYVYDGRRWAPDEMAQIVALAKQTARSIYVEAEDEPERRERELVVKHALTSERDARIRAMISLAQSEPGIPVRPSDFDADPYAFNVLNGTIDLRTGKIKPHDRRDLITKLAPVTWNPDAQCDRWEAFIHRVMNGDRERVGYIRRAIGYSLTARTDEQCLFLPFGPGANGKTVLEEAMRAIAGDYAVKADFSTFLQHSTDSPRHDLARLFNARVVTASEVNEGKQLDEAVVKDVTGSGTIAARRLYAESFEFSPTFKVWLSSNHRPIIRGTDHGIWRRIRLLPFEVIIPPEERDPRLLDALRAELSGILAWAVSGCIEWNRDGLGLPTAVQVATADYREEMDTLGGFIRDCCELEPDYTESVSALYTAYKRWATAGGEYILNQTRFGRQLSERDIDKFTPRGANTVWRRGIRLSASPFPTVSDSSDPFSPSSSARAHMREVGKGSETVEELSEAAQLTVALLDAVEPSEAVV